MFRTVVIEPWSKDESDVHVHDPDSTEIQSTSGDLCHNTTPRQVIAIGRVSKTLRVMHGKLFKIDSNCRDFCEMVEAINSYDQEGIDRSRGRLEEGGDVDMLSDLDVAYLDWMAREIWADLGRDVDEPFLETQTLKWEIDSMVADHIAEIEERENDAKEAALEYEYESKRDFELMERHGL